MCCFHSRASIRHRAEVATEFLDVVWGGWSRSKASNLLLLSQAILQPTTEHALTLLSQFQK